MSPSLGQPRDELEDLAIPLIVKLGGGMGMVTGAFTLGLAIQTSMIFQMRGMIPAVVATMVVLGVASLFTGWGTLRGRGAAAIGGAVACGLVALLGTAWAITGLMNGLISPLSFGIIPFGSIGAVLTALSIGPTRRITTVRNGLRAQGLDFGM